MPGVRACARDAVGVGRAQLDELEAGDSLIWPDELAEVDEITGELSAEEEFERAPGQRGDVGAGTPTASAHPVGDDEAAERVGRAWTQRAPRSGWGTP